MKKEAKSHLEPTAQGAAVQLEGSMKNNMTSEYIEQNSWWVRGELTEELAFAHNSVVEMILSDGRKKKGWIVGASVESPVVVFTVEACDGSGDFMCIQSSLRKVEIENEPNLGPLPNAGASPFADEASPSRG